MKIIKTECLTHSQKKDIYTLWNNEYPVNLMYSSFEDFKRYLKNLSQKHHLLLVDDQEKVKGWYFDFDRENQKWFAMILSTTIQGKGFGTNLLKYAKKNNSELNGWVIDHTNYKKIDGTIYKSPIQFYSKNNFKILPKIRLELETISAVKIKWNS